MWPFQACQRSTATRLFVAAARGEEIITHSLAPKPQASRLHVKRTRGPSNRSYSLQTACALHFSSQHHCTSCSCVKPVLVQTTLLRLVDTFLLLQPRAYWCSTAPTALTWHLRAAAAKVEIARVGDPAANGTIAKPVSFCISSHGGRVTNRNAAPPSRAQRTDVFA